MTTTKFRLVVVPDVEDLTMVAGCTPAEIGTNFSTANNFLTSPVGDTVTSVFRADVILGINPAALARAIMTGIRQNLSGTHTVISVDYNFRHVSDPNQIAFNPDVGHMLIELCNILISGSCDWFHYENSPSMEMTRKFLEVTPPKEEEEPIDPFGGLFPVDNGDDDEEEDDGRHKYKKKKKKGHQRTKYRESVIIQNTKNPKKDYEHHGVIICRDKDDLERDRKTIKAFLNDFIPGDARWKREFREDLLDRWLPAFTIRKKKLNKLVRKAKKRKRQKKQSAATAIAMDISRRIMTAQDPWMNPNK